MGLSSRAPASCSHGTCAIWIELSDGETTSRCCGACGRFSYPLDCDWILPVCSTDYRTLEVQSNNPALACPRAAVLW
eukprot:6162769-Prymnesium_polylepis.1